MALGCSVSTISKFERGVTKQLYSIDYKVLAHELNLTGPINH
jgi:transcriptional regulator with XRE-family HTH domain